MDTHLSQLKKVYFDGIFLEEGHRASNSESGIFNKFGNVLQANATIIITGTVVQSRLSQFMNVLKLIDQELFKIIENYKFTEKDIETEPLILDLFRAIIGILCLRREASSLQNGTMPDVDEFLLLCKMSPKQKKYYDTVNVEANSTYQTMRRAASSMEIDVSDESKSDCNAAVEEKASEGSVKWNALQQILEEQHGKNNKVIVFTTFVKTLQWLSGKCADVDIKTVNIHGRKGVGWNQRLATSNEEKIQLFKTDPDVKTCIATYGSLAYGVNLQQSNVVVFFEMSDTANDILQAKCRIIRMNQQKRCFIYYLVTLNTVEMDVYFKHFTEKVKLNDILITDNKYLHIPHPTRQIIFLEQDLKTINPIEHYDSAEKINEKKINLNLYAKTLEKKNSQAKQQVVEGMKLKFF